MPNIINLGNNIVDFGATGPTGPAASLGGLTIGGTDITAIATDTNVSLSANGVANVIVNSNSNSWIFDSTGILNLPLGQLGDVERADALDLFVSNTAPWVSLTYGEEPTNASYAYWETYWFGEGFTIQGRKSNYTGYNLWAFQPDGNLTTEGSVIPGTDGVANLGSSDYQWQQLYVSNNVKISNGSITVTGAGQTSANFDTTGSLGGAILAHDTGVAPGNGGAVVFGAAGGNWKFAAIKGYVTDGTSNTQGDIVFSTRHSYSDATLTEAMRIDTKGSVSIGIGNVTTNATDGFLYIPTCNGAPVGTPTSKTGLVPMVYDSSTDKLYIYNGGWKSAMFS